MILIQNVGYDNLRIILKENGSFYLVISCINEVYMNTALLEEICFSLRQLNLQEMRYILGQLEQILFLLIQKQ